MAQLFSRSITLLNKVSEFWIYFFFSIFIASYLWFIISYPIDYWDMLPYMGAVVELDGGSISEIHAQTYSSFINFANDLQEKKYSMDIRSVSVIFKILIISKVNFLFLVSNGYM